MAGHLCAVSYEFRILVIYAPRSVRPRLMLPSSSSSLCACNSWRHTQAHTHTQRQVASMAWHWHRRWHLPWYVGGNAKAKAQKIVAFAFDASESTFIIWFLCSKLSECVRCMYFVRDANAKRCATFILLLRWGYSIHFLLFNIFSSLHSLSISFLLNLHFYSYFFFSLLPPSPLMPLLLPVVWSCARSHSLSVSIFLETNFMRILSKWKFSMLNLHI